MKKRSYKITFGLKEGYSSRGKHHTLNDAERVIKDWMTDRLKHNYPIVNGLLQDGKLFFPSVEPTTSKSAITVSHSAIFTGELSSAEDILRKNREVKVTLESLAFKIKKDLNQQSVFIIYKNKNWCI